MSEQKLEEKNSETENEILLQWSYHPFKEKKGRGVIGIVIILAFLVAVYISLSSILWVLFCMLILGLGVMTFYFPTHYKITESNISSRCLINKKSKNWDDLRRYEEAEEGVLLSPMSKPSFLDRFRGLYVGFNKNRDEILEIIKKKLNESD